MKALVRELAKEVFGDDPHWELSDTMSPSVAVHLPSGCSIRLRDSGNNDILVYTVVPYDLSRYIAGPNDLTIVADGAISSACIKRVKQFAAECEAYFMPSYAEHVRITSNITWASKLSHALSAAHFGAVDTTPILISYDVGVDQYRVSVVTCTADRFLSISDDFREALQRRLAAQAGE